MIYRNFASRTPTSFFRDRSKKGFSIVRGERERKKWPSNLLFIDALIKSFFFHNTLMSPRFKSLDRNMIYLFAEKKKNLIFTRQTMLVEIIYRRDQLKKKKS